MSRAIFLCDCCNKQSMSILRGADLPRPEGWLVRVRPDGETEMVCSQACAEELMRATGRRSFIMPRNMEGIRHG